jgi:2-methylcitrate dehydratase PrpD
VTLDQFEPEYYDNPLLRDFAANKVEILPDDELINGQAIAEVDTNDGNTMSARCDYPLGAPENPLSPDQLEEKLRNCAGYCITDNKIDKLACAINDIENVTSVGELMTMMRNG